MGIFCILFDKKKQYFSLLADVFNITGHKLLIALDENKAIELLKVSEPEVIILPAEDIDFWFKLLELGKYTMPILFVESYEVAESLRKYGLRDVNCVVLPFNPMELLTKIVSLSKESQDVATLSAIGPVNLLLKLLRKGTTSSLVIEDEENSCIIYIHEGIIKGSNCNRENLLTLISKDVKTSLDIYEEDKAVMKCLYKNNWDFLSSLVYGYVTQAVSQTDLKVEELEISKSAIDISQPIQIGDGLFWVGVPQEGGLFQKNSYLRIYEKESIRIPILINIGIVQDYVLIRSKLEQVVGTVDAIKAVVVLGSSVDECSAILSMLQSNQRAFIITSLSIAQRLKALGIPQARIRAFETFPNRKLRLATGNVLRFIPLPFLPERGSFAMLEEGSGYLFTGRFLSSLCTYEELNPIEGGDVEDVLIYTNHIIPSKDTLNRAMKQINTEEITSILPMFGNPVYSEDKIKELFASLERIPLSVTFEPNDREVVLKSCNSLIKHLKENLEVSEFQAFLEEFNHFAHMEDDRILEFFVEPDSIPSLILSLMYARGLNPVAIKHTIKHFYITGLPFTI